MMNISLTPEALAQAFEDLPSNCREVMAQLFVFGPTWDGDVASKMGRDELCSIGLAEHKGGWAFLTPTGVIFASNVRLPVDSRGIYNLWRRKQRNERYAIGYHGAVNN